MLEILANVCTSSFASDSLIKRLNISATSKIEITTVTINKAKETRFAKLINHLEVSDFNVSDFFKLQPSLSITSIPIVTIFHYLAVALAELDYFELEVFFCYVTMLIMFCKPVFI